jgi:hypothetical protein
VRAWTVAGVILIGASAGHEADRRLILPNNGTVAPFSAAEQPAPWMGERLRPASPLGSDRSLLLSRPDTRPQGSPP